MGDKESDRRNDKCEWNESKTPEEVDKKGGSGME